MGEGYLYQNWGLTRRYEVLSICHRGRWPCSIRLFTFYLSSQSPTVLFSISTMPLRDTIISFLAPFNATGAYALTPDQQQQQRWYSEVEKRELFRRSPLALPDHRHSSHHPHPGSALATSSQPSTLRYTPADIHRDPSTWRHFGSTPSETSSPDESGHPETITGVLCSFRQIYTEAIDILYIASMDRSKNALGC